MLRSLSATVFLHGKPEAAARLGTELSVGTAWEQQKVRANILLASSQIQTYPLLFLAVFDILRFPEATEGAQGQPRRVSATD